MIINVFISQPMHGFKIEEIQGVRDGIIELIKSQCRNFIANCETTMEPLSKNIDVRVVNPIDRLNAPKDAGRLWYLGRAISDLDRCDFVIFANGWENARGCNIEMETVKGYGIPYCYECDIAHHILNFCKSDGV